jgi:hypothetical protein
MYTAAQKLQLLSHDFFPSVKTPVISLLIKTPCSSIIQNIYTTKQIPLPYPEFFVLYNGSDEYPDESIIKLSASFESPSALGLPEKESPSLELIVKVLNINEGRNAQMVRKCETLAQYSAFIEKAREFQKQCSNLEEAIKKAIVYCHEHDILKEFLEKHATEVLNMLMTEWKLDDALAVRYEEGWECGMEDGRAKERVNFALKLLRRNRPIKEIIEDTGLTQAEIEALLL